MGSLFNLNKFSARYSASSLNRLVERFLLKSLNCGQFAKCNNGRNQILNQSTGDHKNTLVHLAQVRYQNQIFQQEDHSLP